MGKKMRFFWQSENQNIYMYDQIILESIFTSFLLARMLAHKSIHKKYLWRRNIKLIQQVWRNISLELLT